MRVSWTQLAVSDVVVLGSNGWPPYHTQRRIGAVLVYELSWLGARLRFKGTLHCLRLKFH